MKLMNVIACGYGLAAVISACSSFPSTRKELEAEGRYGAEQYAECVAPEPILGPKASVEQRRAAWDRVDACRARVQARWDIVEVAQRSWPDAGDAGKPSDAGNDASDAKAASDAGGDR